MIDTADLLRLGTAQLFGNIGLESVEHLLGLCDSRHLVRGERLLEPGTPNQHLYLLLDGELRVYLGGSEMPEHAILKTGDCVGEMSLIDGKTVSALVIAAEDSRLLAVPHDVLWAMVDCSHGVARNLLAILAGRMRDNNLALVASQSRSLEFEQAGCVDPLTGVHSRRWLLDAYPRALQRCARDNAEVCLILTDIDHFRHFNDRFGHLAGDAVLREIAKRLADGLRPQDLVARLAGEQFLLLLPHTQPDQALLIAERLRGLVASVGAGEAEGASGITISCGIAAQRGGEAFETLLTRATAAMRLAKENGRDRVEFDA